MSKCDISIQPLAIPAFLSFFDWPPLPHLLSLSPALFVSLSLSFCSSRHIQLQVILCTSGTDWLIWGRWKKGVYSSGPRQEWIHWGRGAQVRIGCVCARVLHLCVLHLCCKSLRQRSMYTFPLWINSVIHERRTGEWLMERRLWQLGKAYREIKCHQKKIKSMIIQCWTYLWSFLCTLSDCSYRISLRGRGSWLWLRPRVWWLQEIKMVMARLGWKVGACKTSDKAVSRWEK